MVLTKGIYFVDISNINIKLEPLNFEQYFGVVNHYNKNFIIKWAYDWSVMLLYRIIILYFDLSNIYDGDFMGEKVTAKNTKVTPQCKFCNISPYQTKYAPFYFSFFMHSHHQSFISWVSNSQTRPNPWISILKCAFFPLPHHMNGKGWLE